MRRAARTILFLAMALSVGLWTACDSKKGDGGEAEAEVYPVPPTPTNGSPVAATFVAFHRDDKRPEVELRLYNFGDKSAGGYKLLIKYLDESGAPITVQPGTPFEKGYDFTSLSGGRDNICKPKEHQTVQAMVMEIPENAVTAEILVSGLQAVAEDGLHLEDWWEQDDWTTWPEGAGASATP